MAASCENEELLKIILEQLLASIKKFSRCQSVAIRLSDKGDFPYYLHKGFPEYFIIKENSLNVRDKTGRLILDADQTPVVECMCGNILKRRFDPKYPYFTENGAFWTSSTTQLLQSLTEKEKQQIGNTRNTCHDFGYESVALIPIHSNEKVVGLIQLNDPRENMFTLKAIEIFQSLADHVGRIISVICDFLKVINEKPGADC